MSTETRTSTKDPKPRRKLLIAAVLATFAIGTTSAVAFWSGDSWSDEAMSSAFPGLPGGDWASTSSADGWGESTSSSTSVASSTTAGTTSSQPTSTAVVEQASAAPTKLPTSKAPAPTTTPTSSSTAVPAPTSTSAPDPTSTHDNPKPKPTSTKKPTPTSSPTSSGDDGGCVLLVIC
jgi:hypothetical protein